MINNPIAKSIQNKILSGEYPPGKRLPGQRYLATELGVSRSALREAFSVLETLGLVDIRQAKGVFVPNSPKDSLSGNFLMDQRAKQIFEFRSVTEPYAASMASQLRSSDDLSRLRKTVYSMRYALEEERLIDAAQEDFSFHHIILSILKNPVFTDAMRPIAADIHNTQCKPLLNKEKLMKPLEEHQDIFDAIVKKDKERARSAMVYHIAEAEKRSQLREEPL